MYFISKPLIMLETLLLEDLPEKLTEKKVVTYFSSSYTHVAKEKMKKD